MNLGTLLYVGTKLVAKATLYVGVTKESRWALFWVNVLQNVELKITIVLPLRNTLGYIRSPPQLVCS